MRYSDLTLFLSGPVTGKPDRNVEAFMNAKLALRSVGYTEILTPFDYVPPTDNWEQAMRKTIAAICLKADAVALLDDDTASRGSAIERALAFDLKIPTKPIREWIDKADWRVSDEVRVAFLRH